MPASSPLRDARATRRPLAARVVAIALPIPRLAPVISATRPSRLPWRLLQGPSARSRPRPQPRRLDTGGEMAEPSTTHLEDRNTNGVGPSRPSQRPAQRDRPPRQPQRDRPAAPSSGRTSRSELVARTGLTRTAIRALIGELVAGDLVVEEPGESDGTAGRPSPLVRPRPGAIVLGSRSRSTRWRRRSSGSVARPSRRFASRARGATPSTRSSRTCASWRRTCRSRRTATRSSGSASPWRASCAARTVWCPVPRTLAGTTCPSGRSSRRRSDDVPVRSPTRQTSARMAELRRGAARGADNLLLIGARSVSVAGSSYGVPLTGVSGYAGEVGHMPVNPDGRRCGCGSTGCWETEVGEGALLRHAGRAPDGGPDEVDEVLRLARGRCGRTGRPAHGRAVAGHRARRPREPAQPALIVLGGLFARVHPFIDRALDAQLDGMTPPAPRRVVRVAPAALGIDAPFIGAAELALEPLRRRSSRLARADRRTPWRARELAATAARRAHSRREAKIPVRPAAEVVAEADTLGDSLTPSRRCTDRRAGFRWRRHRS